MLDAKTGEVKASTKLYSQIGYYSNIIYGGGLTAAFDVWLTDRIILLMQVKERALFGTDAGNFHTQVGLGVRFIIN